MAKPAAGSVAVSPQPGTPDASPSTQISFLGGPGTTVTGVRVVGSSSGAHSGSLRAYSTGTGESFLPSHPFRAGEKVTVHAQAGGTPVSTSFTIAHQATVSQKQFPLNPGDARAVQHYSSAPSLTPSTVRITTAAKPGATPGDLFLAPYQGKGTPGPMIADQKGNLVWFQPLPAGRRRDQLPGPAVPGQAGAHVVAGPDHPGRLRRGRGRHLRQLLPARRDDQGRQRLPRRPARDPAHPEGTAWIDVFDPIQMNLSSVHGSADGILLDSVVQEIDIKTGLVMWEWHSLGHIPLSESNNPVRARAAIRGTTSTSTPSTPAPPATCCSPRATPGRCMTSTSAAAPSAGAWAASTAASSSARARFEYWQHDAEFQPGGLISVFDNGSDPPKEKQSRGLLLRPDTASHTVALVKQFVNPSKTLLADSQGNTLSLPGGNWLLGYGGLPNFTEFDASGHVLLDGTLGKNVQNFKTFLSPWSGQPAGRPSLVVKAAGAGRDQRRGQLERRDRGRLLARARREPRRARSRRSRPRRSRAFRRRSRCTPPVRTWPCRRSTARAP